MSDEYNITYLYHDHLKTQEAITKIQIITLDANNFVCFSYNRKLVVVDVQDHSPNVKKQTLVDAVCAKKWFSECFKLKDSIYFQTCFESDVLDFVWNEKLNFLIVLTRSGNVYGLSEKNIVPNR